MKLTKYLLLILTVALFTTSQTHGDILPDIWCVGTNAQPYIRTGITKDNLFGTGWTQVDPLPDGKSTLYVAVGPQGQVWATATTYEIYYRTNITPTNQMGTGWGLINGGLTQVAIGNGVILGVHAPGSTIWFRTGITATNPIGTGWEQIAGGLINISISKDGIVWGINNGGAIFYWNRPMITQADKSAGTWVGPVSGASGTPVYISAGCDPQGNILVWYANSAGSTYYRTGVTLASLGGTNWVQVDSGTRPYISIDNYLGIASSIDSSGNMFFKSGITQTSAGSSWIADSTSVLANKISIGNIATSFYSSPAYSQTFSSLGYAAHWSPNSAYLAIGGVNFPYDLNVYAWDGTSLELKDAESFGNGVKAIDWSPDGNFLAIGGNNPTQNLIIHQWDGNALTLTTSKYHGTEVRATAWSPNGNYLAVGGDWGPYDVAIYNWNGSNLSTTPTTRPHGTGATTGVYGLSWHPTGNYIAVAGNYGTQDLIIYGWNGTSMNLLTPRPNKDIGTQAYAVQWSNSGNYLAVGGNNGTNNVIIYSWANATLTQLTTLDYGTKVLSLAWSFDDQYLAIGGDSTTFDSTVYEWNGVSLTPIDNSRISYDNGIYSIAWSPYADYLAVTGNNNLANINIYNILGYLNGTKNNIYLTNNYNFFNGGSAQGNVNIANGCTISAGQKLKCALLAPLSGTLNLNTSGILELEDDLYLGATATLASGGFISGQNHAIYLGNNLTIPDSSVIHIASNTIIDGQGHDLVLGRWSQILIDQNITLTLKNLTIKNTINNQGFPPIKCATSNSKLALDNVELTPTNDFYFNEGQLFIHNDVIFTGTSQFHYMSSKQSYIATGATFAFEPNTTFYYDTVSTYTPNPTGINFSASNKIYPRNNQLITMQDITSALYLNGCSLQISHTGLRLTKGQLLLENTLTLTNKQITNLVSSTNIPGSNLTLGGSGYQTAWSPDSKYLAAGSSNGTFNIYSWNGSTLTLISSTPMSASTFGCSWSPDQKYIAVCGDDTPQGTNNIIIYEWDGLKLTKKNNNNLGTTGYAYRPTWSPDGKYLAVGSDATTNTLGIFSWNGLSLTLTASKAHTPACTYISASWSHDGNYIADYESYGGSSSSSVNIWQWDTTKPNDTKLRFKTSLSPLTQVSYAGWSPDDRYFVTCSYAASNNLIVYEWNAALGKLIDPSPSANTNKKTFTNFCLSASWSNNGRYLAAGGGSTGAVQSIMFYSWDGSSLTPITAASQAFGTVIAMQISPNDQYLAVAGTNTPQIIVYKINYTTLPPTNPAYQQSLFFGNSALGKDYDLNFNMLNGARITKNCTIKYDNFN